MKTPRERAEEVAHEFYWRKHARHELIDLIEQAIVEDRKDRRRIDEDTWRDAEPKERKG